MDFLKKLNITELIEAYSQIISLLKERKVIRTKNLIGDLAEYLIINHYNNTAGLSNLQAAPAGTQNVDALSRQGARYSIKATTGNLTGVFYGLNSPQSTEKEIQKFEFIIVACFDENYNLVRIIELTWEQFLKNKRWHKTMNAWNISITSTLSLSLTGTSGISNAIRTSGQTCLKRSRARKSISRASSNHSRNKRQDVSR